jgi:hypothetical protein
MTTQGFDHLYLETHNWGKSVAFWEGLGFKVDFETDITVASSWRRTVPASSLLSSRRRIRWGWRCISASGRPRPARPTMSMSCSTGPRRTGAPK